MNLLSRICVLSLLVVAGTACNGLTAQNSIGKKTTEGEDSASASPKATVAVDTLQDKYLDKVNYGLVEIKSTDSDCDDSQKLFSLGRPNTTINDKLVEGCNYQVIVDLGNQDLTNPSAKFVPYYRSAAYEVSASDIKSALKKNKKLSIQLDSFSLTTRGKNEGLPDYNQIIEGASGSSTEATPPTGTAGTTGNTTSGATGNVPATPAQTKFSGFSQIQLQTPQGQTTTMDQVVKGKYVLIDLSSPGCGPCREVAEEMAKNSAYQAVLNSGKCSQTTIITQNEYQEWLQAFPPSSNPTGAHSYGLVNNSFEGLPQIFGARFSNFIPYVIIVDVATGKTVSKSEELSEFVNMCQ